MRTEAESKLDELSRRSASARHTTQVTLSALCDALSREGGVTGQEEFGSDIPKVSALTGPPSQVMDDLASQMRQCGDYDHERNKLTEELEAVTQSSKSLREAALARLRDVCYDLGFDVIEEQDEREHSHGPSGSATMPSATGRTGQARASCDSLSDGGGCGSRQRLRILNF